MTKGRIQYLDVLKFLGMICIYIGHYGKSVGDLYPFVFTFHVPLFFLAAGCSETFNKERSLLKSIGKKCLAILFPFFVFSVIAIVVYVLCNGADLGLVKEHLKVLLHGSPRNHFKLSQNLWFLSCLFVMSVVFDVIKRVQWKWLILSIALAMHVAYVVKPTVLPLDYNIAQVFQYMIYYALGYVLFDSIHCVLTSSALWAQIVKWSTGIVAGGYTAMLFFKKNVYTLLQEVAYVKLFIPLLTALTAVWFFFFLSYLLCNVKLFADMGRDTLYFCGNEMPINAFSKALLQLCFDFKIPGPLSGLIYAFLLLFAQHRWVVPGQKRLMTVCQQNIKAFFQKWRRRNVNGVDGSTDLCSNERY